MIDRSIADKLIEFLDAVSIRPAMYFGVEDEPEIAKRYLSGLRAGVSLLSPIDPPHLIIRKWHDAIAAHGYRVTPRSPDREMEEKGMTKREIVAELIRIEQTLYKFLSNESS